MKKDNRGFLLAESLIVSTFVLTVLILLYIQFNNLTTNYQNSYDYNNVESIYDVASVADFLLENGYDLSTQLTSTKPYVVVFKDGYCNLETGISGTFCDTLLNQMGATTVIYTSSDISIIQEYVSSHDDSNINQSFREFISRVETTTILNKGRLFAEFENGTYATIAMDNEVYTEETLTTETVTIGGQTVETVIAGDGLYADESEAGRYIYKGENPDNYIWFNDEMWRIIAKEVDGTYKIIKDESVTYQEYENPNWEESSLNNYLTNTYYTSLSAEVKANIISHNFANGGISDESADLNTIISEENASTWNSYVGLISISDYLKANSNTDSCNTIQSNRNNLSICIETNWLYNEEDYWVINYNGGPTSIHYYITNTGDIDSISRGGLYNGKYVRPVVILTSDITLTGKGTEENPYKIN